MNVALVMERLEPWRGGAETSTQQFIEHLVDCGANVTVLTRSQLPSRPGVAIRTVRVSGATRSSRSAAFARAVDGLAADLDVDLVHAISPCLRAEVYEPRGGTVVETMARDLATRTTPAGRSLKKLAAGFNLRQRLMLDLERRLLEAEPRPVVVALSDYVVRQLREHYDFPESHIRKIFNGVNPDLADEAERREDRTQIRERYSISDDELLVVLVAHNFRLKGVGRWIETVSSLVSAGGPAVRSLVIGRGGTGRWQRLTWSAGVADRVRFVGVTSRIHAFYHAADLLVHPTYYDPCSRVVLEGMVSGLPCVTTRYDGASEVVDDGVNGYVIDTPEDTAALADRVRRLADPRSRKGMGTRAAEIAPRVSMRRHAEQIMALYAQIAERRARA